MLLVHAYIKKMADADELLRESFVAEQHPFLPEAVERYGRSAYGADYKYAAKDGVVERSSSKGRRFVAENVKRVLKDAFLPLGYPDSVSKDYLAYQMWDTMQAFCSSITGTLATHAVLKGAGVGDSSATALAATITWMLKDGAGMIGRILFAWFQGLMADVLNDAAIFLDLLAPFFLEFFLLIMCLSSITRSIVGVAGGATRAALTQHQALRDNMADVSAKDGSQETMVNFVALLVSLVLTPAVVDKQKVVWALFLLFTFLHLFANWRAVRAVIMSRVNRNRFHLLVDMYLKEGGVRSPEYINGKETLLPKEQGFLAAVLGCTLSNVVKSKAQFEQEFENFMKKQKKYMLRLDSKSRKVYVSLNASSSDGDVLKALFHKEVLEYFIQYRRFPEALLREHLEPNSGPLTLRLAATCYNGLASRNDEEELVTLTGKMVDDHFSLLLREIEEAGWDTEHCMLGQGEWRHSWKTQPQGEGP